MRKRHETKDIRTMDCHQSFEVKKVGGDTYIQGWANKAVVDRGKDIINKDAWQLDNFKKVPTILFNHDKDKPVGKGVDVRPTDQGLWIKAKISNSKDPTISMVRDLVNEGMLNAFSVGFEAKDEQKNTDGVNEITNAELYECSIVTLPMNQDSVFDVSTKSLVGLTRPQAVSRILSYKGAWVAEAVHAKIAQMDQSGGKRDDLISQVCDASGVTADNLTQILAGNVTPVPEKVLEALASACDMDLSTLKALDQKDMTPESKGQDEMDEPQDEPMAKDAGSAPEPAFIALLIPKDQAQDADAASAMVSDAGFEPQGVTDEGDSWLVMLADPADFQDQTSQIQLSDSIVGIIGVPKSADQPDQDDQGDQEDQPAQDSSDEVTPPVDGEGKAKPPTPPPAADAKPPADAPPPKKPLPPHPADAPKKPAPAATPPHSDASPSDAPPAKEPAAPPAKEPPQADANPPAGEGKPPAEAPADKPAAADADAVKQEYQSFQQDQQAMADGTTQGPPDWVADQDLWAQANDASQQAVGKVDPAFVLWWYLQNGGSKKSESSTREKRTKDQNTAPISGGGDATIPIDDNPYLAQSRQTNVLLGVLIKTVQELAATMQGTAIKDLAPPEQPVDEKSGDQMPDNSEEMAKMMLVNLKGYNAILKEKLEKIGA